MKLNEETLRQIIKEELEDVLDESALLKKYLKPMKSKFMKKLKDMGKSPRKTYNSLDPQMRSSLGQATVHPGYPQVGDYTVDDVHSTDPRPNPYGGRFHFTFEPEDLSKPGSGIIQIYAIEPQTGDMEFQNAYPVERLSDELKKLAQWQ